MPDIGEDVLCVFLLGGIEDGFVLGSFYAPEVARPTANKDERKVKFKDDTTVTYNRATHELDVVIEGTHIHAVIATGDWMDYHKDIFRQCGLTIFIQGLYDIYYFFIGEIFR